MENFLAVVLGGNTVLRLASQNADERPWLTNFIAWSAASVWAPAVNWPRSISYDRNWNSMKEPEVDATRANTIKGTYENDLSPLLTYTVASTWYCNTYEPCKEWLLERGRESAAQNYHRLRRTWSERLAAEQMIFSHDQPRARVDRIAGRVLLLAGDDDNYNGVHIFDATRELAIKAIGTKGVVWPLASTGHSIHAERPRELASLIQSFLPGPHPGDGSGIWRGWRSLGGEATSSPAVGMNEDGALEIFVRGPANTIFAIRQLAPNGQWMSGIWSELEGGFNPETEFGQQIAVERGVNGSLEVFCHLTSHDRLANVLQDGANGEWGNWATGNDFSQLIAGTTDSAFVIGRFAEGERIGGSDLMLLNHTRLLLVGARTANGLVHVRGQNRDGAWWPSGQNVADPDSTFEGTPVPINGMSGKTFIFARGTDAHIYCAGLVGDTDWDQDWVELSGESVSTDVSAELDALGDVYVVVRDRSGNLMVCHNNGTDNSWTDWEVHSANIAPSAKPIIVRNPWGELQVFATWRGGTVRTTRQLLGTRSWTEWEDLGGATNRMPAVAVNANGMLSVVISGQDGEVYINTMQFDSPRVFSSAVRSSGKITHLVTDSEERCAVSTVIDDILSSRVTYWIRDETGELNELVVREYLTTGADEDPDNNLSQLPVLRIGGVPSIAPPNDQRERVVTHYLDAGGSFGTKRFYNQDEGWSINERQAFLQVLNGTHKYYLVDSSGNENKLVAMRYLSTYPDELESNNLGALPNLVPE